MNKQPVEIHEIDRFARGLYAEAIAQLPPRTRERLRGTRARSTKPARTDGLMPGWALATACAALFAITVGTALAPRGSAPVEDMPLASDTAGNDDSVYSEALATLDEDPDFYLWLATTDVQPLAME